MTRALTWLMVLVLALVPWFGPALLVAANLAADRMQAWAVVSTTICAIWTPGLLLVGVLVDAWAYRAAIAKATGSAA